VSSELWIGLAASLWVGVLTAISPCPLATNLAAISFIGRRVASPRAALATGLLYAAGRSLVYVGLAVAVVSSLLSAPAVARVLQKSMNQLLGPILVVVGMFLLGLLRWSGGGSRIGEKVGKRAERWGVWAGLALGALFALSFCPVSAALYFGSLIPLAVRCESSVLLPVAYGLGTALPVLAFAFLLVFGARRVGQAYERLARFDAWARRVTGVLFIAVGVGFSLLYVWL
jgi:cytochrome c biogenesis protein CcdA